MEEDYDSDVDSLLAYLEELDGVDYEDDDFLEYDLGDRHPYLGT